MTKELSVRNEFDENSIVVDDMTALTLVMLVCKGEKFCSTASRAWRLKSFTSTATNSEYTGPTFTVAK